MSGAFEHFESGGHSGLAFYTEPCSGCGRDFTVQFFGVLHGEGRSMVSSIPTDEALRRHEDCFEMGSL